MKSFAGQCSSVALMELLITLTLTLRLRFSLHHSLPSWVASAVKILGYVDSALTCMLLRKLTTNERLYCYSTFCSTDTTEGKILTILPKYSKEANWAGKLLGMNETISLGLPQHWQLNEIDFSLPLWKKFT